MAAATMTKDEKIAEQSKTLKKWREFGAEAEKTIKQQSKSIVNLERFSSKEYIVETVVGSALLTAAEIAVIDFGMGEFGTADAPSGLAKFVQTFASNPGYWAGGTQAVLGLVEGGIGFFGGDKRGLGSDILLTTGVSVFLSGAGTLVYTAIKKRKAFAMQQQQLLMNAQQVVAAQQQQQQAQAAAQAAQAQQS